jgi:hypothetical protein
MFFISEVNNSDESVEPYPLADDRLCAKILYVVREAIFKGQWEVEND